MKSEAFTQAISKAEEALFELGYSKPNAETKDFADYGNYQPVTVKPNFVWFKKLDLVDPNGERAVFQILVANIGGKAFTETYKRLTTHLNG